MDFKELAQRRYSVRSYQSKPVEKEKLIALVESALLAPSAVNFQPWKFIVVKELGLKSALDSAARESALHLGINEAPVVILVCVDRRVDAIHAIEAGAAATQNMTLAAHSLGLGSGWIGIWGTEAEGAIRKLLKLPETIRVVSLLPIGVPNESPVIPRKPLEEVIEIF